ncbi:hypothetical protein QE375_002942 [Microbacterium foliorum]|uniref:Uncharacterized protein n=1 Tax=Microbacterium foliorum TaxID=104336 RepID=A0ABU1HTL6_9MICO|nr:hypothetical protein [Microbacterium foliorum]MDR6143388.1 hypothetical protein [Microbacterium foliorum]
MQIDVDVQSVVNRYARALRGPRLLFQLWPNPRKAGRPKEAQSALCGAIVLGVTGAFEAFAEDLVAAAMIRNGYGWAQVAANADLTNPNIDDARAKLAHAAGIDVSGPQNWTLKLPTQSGTSTAWADKPYTWGDVLQKSKSWLEVRHCIAHGAVTGIGAETWPGPLTTKKHGTKVVSANDDGILAQIKGKPAERALYFWPTVSCARIFSAGAFVLAKSVAAEFNESVDLSGVPDFSNV